MLFWTIREYSMSYYGRIWRKALRFISSESFGQWVKWTYEVESKFDIEWNYTFRSVALISLLDCRNVVVSLWLSVILLLLWVPLQWCFSINGSFMYFEVHTFPKNSISFDVQIMCAVFGLIDIMTESFSSLWLDNDLGVLISGFKLYFNLFYSKSTRDNHLTAEIQLCSEVHQNGSQSCETSLYRNRKEW